MQVMGGCSDTEYIYVPPYGNWGSNNIENQFKMGLVSHNLSLVKIYKLSLNALGIMMAKLNS